MFDNMANCGFVQPDCFSNCCNNSCPCNFNSKNNCCCTQSCGKRNSYNAINALALTSVAVPVGSAIPFDTNRVLSGNAINHVAGSTDFTIMAPGTYKATLTTNAALNTGEVAGFVSIAIAINGTIIPGCLVSQTIAPTETTNLYTQVLFTIPCGTPATVTAVNPVGAAPTVYTNTNMIIEKVC